jgi:serine/threonine protein kinase
VGKKSVTQADARMGTLAYMSPEQIRGATLVTAQSDIFSLGATLYELATCKVAFDGHSDYDIMHQIVEGKYANPGLVAEMELPIAAAIRRSLQPDLAERFLTCEEFAATLGSLGGSEGSLAAHQDTTAPLPDTDLGSSRRMKPEILEVSGEATKPCPYCREPILTNAKKCKHCFEYLDSGLRKRHAAHSGDSQVNVVGNPGSQFLTPWSGTKNALLSLFLPGLGQFLSNRTRSALLWFGAAVLWYLCLGFPSACLLHLASAFYAYKKPNASQ